MIFGERLSELRSKKNLTQAQLAAELNISKHTVSNYELGKSSPTREILTRIEDFFNVRTDFLMDKQDEFIAEAQARGGYHWKIGAEQLVKEVNETDFPEVDKDAVMRALMEAYWEAKEENKKYTPKKHRK